MDRAPYHLPPLCHAILALLSAAGLRDKQNGPGSREPGPGLFR